MWNCDHPDLFLCLFVVEFVKLAPASNVLGLVTDTTLYLYYLEEVNGAKLRVTPVYHIQLETMSVQDIIFGERSLLVWEKCGHMSPWLLCQ